MPVYDYLCVRCGPFSDLRPMAASALPQECPTCRQDAPRAFLTAPYFATMSTERRLAHAANERSASAPRAMSGLRQTHGSGCRCCSSKSLSNEEGGGRGANSSAAKSFPTRRPWMLSH
jgi:putative FmdB family regulatory protein